MLARTENIQVMLQDVTVEAKHKVIDVKKTLEKVGNTLKWIATKNGKKREEFNAKKNDSKKPMYYNKEICEDSTPDRSIPTTKVDRSKNKQPSRIKTTDPPKVQSSKEKSKNLRRITFHQRSGYKLR